DDQKRHGVPNGGAAHRICAPGETDPRHPDVRRIAIDFVTGSTAAPSLCGESRATASASAGQHDHSYRPDTRRYGPDPNRSDCTVGATECRPDLARTLATHRKRYRVGRGDVGHSDIGRRCTDAGNVPTLALRRVGTDGGRDCQLTSPALAALPYRCESSPPRLT